MTLVMGGARMGHSETYADIVISGASGSSAVFDVPPGASIDGDRIQVRSGDEMFGYFLHQTTDAPRPGEENSVVVWQRQGDLDPLYREFATDEKYEDQKLLRAGRYRVNLMASGTRRITIAIPVRRLGVPQEISAQPAFRVSVVHGDVEVPGSGKRAYSVRDSLPYDGSSSRVVIYVRETQYAGTGVGREQSCALGNAQGADGCRASGPIYWDVLRDHSHSLRIAPNADLPKKGIIVSQFEGVAEPKRFWRTLLSFSTVPN